MGATDKVLRDCSRCAHTTFAFEHRQARTCVQWTAWQLGTMLQPGPVYFEPGSFGFSCKDHETENTWTMQAHKLHTGGVLPELDP